MAALTPEQLRHEFAGPATSILNRAGHILTAINRWCVAIMGGDARTVERPPLVSHADLVAYESVVRERVNCCLAGLSDERLSEVHDFQMLRGTYRASWGEALRHVINHGTYHRGQIATLLTLRNVDYPDTDYIFWLATRDRSGR